MTTLRIFVPAADRAASGDMRWLLVERRAIAREGVSRVDEMPRADEVEAILPAARVLFARLKLPRVSDATVRELLPFAVEDRLLADPAQIHAVAGRSLAGGDTVVAVVDRQWLQALTRALAGAGRTPRHAWCEGALPRAEGGVWHVVLRDETGVLVDDAGISTTFDWQASGSLPLALRIALDEATPRGERPHVVKVHEDFASDGTALPDLAGWSAESSIAFERAQPWREIEALAPAGDAIDLLAGDFAPRSRAAAAIRVPRAAALLAAAIAVLQLGFTAADTWRLQRERSTLEARREAIFRSAFPEARVVVDPDLQMARNLAQLRAAHGMASGDDFLVRLTQAARASDAGAMRVEYAKGELKVQRAANSGAAR